jgi:hypothetical protein
MDVAGLSLAVLTAYKEVYLIAKFIYSTAASARNSESERRDLSVEFKYELLFLQSLGVVFFRGEGIMFDADLDQVSTFMTFQIVQVTNIL